jgi:hypothetical protein
MVVGIRSSLGYFGRYVPPVGSNIDYGDGAKVMTPDYVLQALQERIRQDLDTIFEQEKLRVVERLEIEKEKVIATTMLRLSKHLSIETLGQTITLRIEK